MNECVKNKVKWKKNLKKMLKMGEQKMIILNFKLQYIFLKLLIKGKNDYNCQFASKLNNPKAGAKTYWSILKSVYSRKKINLSLTA